ncbi:MAG: hypothetical protein DMG22_07285 [Acidobacteria bacterium]|nr:MAG: hypothetical protein DMG22_07285 [Acidobacteriota bacterium]
MCKRYEIRPTKRRLILLGWILAAAVIFVNVEAVQGMPQESNFTLEGKITEKSAGKLTLSTTDNIIFHVRYDDKTEIKRADGSAGSGADLKVGQTVSVVGELAETGEIIAKKIEIEKPVSSKDHS